MSDIRAVRTADGRTLTPVQVAAHEGVQRRIMWPSMHWGVEGVHADAWPHIAMAAADAILAEFDVAPRGVHNHDIDPACPERRMPDGSLRGECITNASPPTVKPSVEDVARVLFKQDRGHFGVSWDEAVRRADAYSEWHDTVVRYREGAAAVLALLPGRTEGEVKAEAWDEGERHESEHLTTFGQFCPHGPQCNPYRKEQS